MLNDPKVVDSNHDIVATLRMFNGLIMDQAADEIERLRAQLNTPVVDDFMRGVVLEAAHQRERWGTDHDAGKTPADWFWLIGYVAGKALTAAISGNGEKFKHHVITTAAVCANWHLYATGVDTKMRPGIEPPND